MKELFSRYQGYDTVFIVSLAVFFATLLFVRLPLRFVPKRKRRSAAYKRADNISLGIALASLAMYLFRGMTMNSDNAETAFVIFLSAEAVIGLLIIFLFVRRRKLAEKDADYLAEYVKRDDWNMKSPAYGWVEGVPAWENANYDHVMRLTTSKGEKVRAYLLSSRREKNYNGVSSCKLCAFDLERLDGRKIGVLYVCIPLKVRSSKIPWKDPDGLAVNVGKKYND